MSVLFTYGDYSFEPAPLFSIQSEPLKTNDGSGYGILHQISLEGTILLSGADSLNSGIKGLTKNIDQFKKALDHDGKPLVAYCRTPSDLSPEAGPDIADWNLVLSGYPTIGGYTIESPDNYTRRANYTVDFTMPTLFSGSYTGADPFNSGRAPASPPPFIESVSETWDVEFQDERMPFHWTITGTTEERFGYKLAVTHNVNVQARIAYTGDRKSNRPWYDALSYATGLLEYSLGGPEQDKYGSNAFVQLTGVLNLPGSGAKGIKPYNHYRQVSTNKTEGTIDITETFLVVPTGYTTDLPPNAIETFNVDTNQEEGIVSVSIQGEIQGLCDINYTGVGGMRASSKYAAATGYWNVVRPRLFDRADKVYQALGGSGLDACAYSRSLNPIVRGRAIGMSPIEGTITYSYNWDTTPQNCISGDCIISQNISIDDQFETDVFAQQVVLGRAAGPILQDIGTVTARVRTINIELVTIPPTGCGDLDTIYDPVPTGQITNLTGLVYDDLTANYSQVFISQNTQNWNFTQGRYTKSVGFTYNTCST